VRIEKEYKILPGFLIFPSFKRIRPELRTSSLFWNKCLDVLGLARTELIFTGIQEGI